MNERTSPRRDDDDGERLIGLEQEMSPPAKWKFIIIILFVVVRGVVGQPCAAAVNMMRDLQRLYHRTHQSIGASKGGKWFALGADGGL